MIKQGQINKYLLYAFGEIFLVVIGILIAVNINNLNESNKQRNAELKYLTNLKSDFESDILLLDDMIELAEKKVKAAIDEKLNSDAMVVPSVYEFSQNMMDLVFVDEFRPNDNTYEEMKNSGNLSIIKNDSIKEQLLNLRKSYSELEAAAEHIRFDFNVFLEDYIHYIDWGKHFNLRASNIPSLEFEFDSTYIEENQQAMKSEVLNLYKNKVFLNNMYLFEVNYTFMSNLFQDTKEQIIEIKASIKQEIKEK